MLQSRDRGLAFAIAALMAVGPLAGSALAQTGQPAAAGIATDGPESWEQEAKVLPSEPGGLYGNDVAIDGDRFIVGARDIALVEVHRSTDEGPVEETFPSAPGSATAQFGRSVGIDGDLAVVGDDGSAFVFEDLSGANEEPAWTHVDTLTPPANPDDDFRGFGASVAIDEATTTAVVGAPFEDTVDGEDRGAAFVYSLEGGSWTVDEALESSTPGGDDEFGVAVALEGTTLLVGAPGDADPGDPPSFGPFGSFGQFPGSVDVFEGGDSGWTQTAHLVGSHPGEDTGFGHAIAFDGDRAVVATTDPAYVFDGFPNPSETARLFPDERLTEDNGFFERQVGWSLDDVGLHEDTVLLGTTSNSAFPGNVDVFQEEEPGSWSMVTELRQRDARSHATPENPGFGKAVAIGGQTALAGAWSEDSLEGQYQGGAVYVFAPCTDDGPLSGPIHDGVEPTAGPAEETVHEANCEVLASNGG